MTWGSYTLIIGAIVSAPILIARLLKACASLDKNVPPPLVDMAKRVLDKEVNTRLALVFFLSRFDLLFCSREGGHPRFFRCAVFSGCMFFIIFSFWIIFHAMFAPDELQEFIGFIFSPSKISGIPLSATANSLIVLSVIVGVNIIGDYCSLLETRYILVKLKETNSIYRVIAFWIFDIVLSISIFGIAYILVICLWSLCLLVFLPEPIIWPRFSQELLDNSIGVFTALFWDNRVYTFSIPAVGQLISICLYTTLSTTIWAGMSIVVMKFWVLLRIANVFPMVKKSPFGALTLIVVILLVVFVSLVTLVF